MKGTNTMSRLISNTRVVEDSGTQDVYEPGVLDALLSTLGELHTGVRSLNGAFSRGTSPREIINGQSVRVSNVAGRLAGFSFRETAGDAAVIRLRDGFDTSGGLIATTSLAANESVRDWFMPDGISFGSGLYVEILSGTIEGVVHLADWPDTR